MNSIVERLRDYQESWAESINRMDCGEFGDNGIMSQIRAEQHATWKEAADLIEAQEQRIKELEAENERLYKAGETQLAAKHKAEANEKELFNALAALRQRIDDAPVRGYNFSYTDNFGRVVWDVDHAVRTDAIEYRSLISKEDI